MQLTIPSAPVRWASVIVSHPLFEACITFCIVLNTIVLSLDSEPELTFAPANRLELINEILSWVFVAESCLKLYAIGFRQWAKDKFNIFDGVLVVLSLVEFVIELFATSDECSIAGSGGAFTVLRTFRLFRVVRAFKLARSWKSLQKIIFTIFNTLKEIGNFGILLLLFMYIFALIGMQSFAYKYRFDEDGYSVPRFDDEADVRHAFDDAGIIPAPPLCYINTAFYSFERPRANFDDLVSAMVAVFQILTGENWNGVMYDAWNCCGWSSVLYFVALVIIGSFIVFNLLIAIMLQSFGSDSRGGGEEEADHNEDQEAGIAARMRWDLAKQHMLVGANRSAVMVPNIARRRWDLVKQHVLVGANRSAVVVPETAPEDDGSTPDDEDATKQAHAAGQSARRDAIKVDQPTNEAVIAQTHTSLWIFKPKNPFRNMSTRAVTHRWFDNFILLSIFVSSVMLAIDSPLMAPECGLLAGLKKADLFFVAVFIVECALKVVSAGLIMHPGSYLRNSWNVLDFLIVLISIGLEVAPSGGQATDLRALRTLRSLRALRPLRVISRNPGLKLVVNALFMAIPKMLSTMVVMMLFFLIFAIVGVNYFKGQLSYCVFPDLSVQFTEAHRDLIRSRGTHYYDNPHYYHQLYANLSASAVYTADGGAFAACDFPTSKVLCEEFGGFWAPVRKQNFDNVGSGMLALFEMTSSEQWVDIMYV